MLKVLFLFFLFDYYTVIVFNELYTSFCYIINHMYMGHNICSCFVFIVVTRGVFKTGPPRLRFRGSKDMSKLGGHKIFIIKLKKGTKHFFLDLNNIYVENSCNTKTNKYTVAEFIILRMSLVFQTSGLVIKINFCCLSVLPNANR